MGVSRLLELIFFVYFLSHIPITILVDSQAVFPKTWYPEQLRDVLQWYGREFRDPMMMKPPIWFKSFCVCEMFLQFPFFFVATYAFWKGGCRWIRVPSIIYGTHVATTLVPILSHVLLYDFTNSPNPGPSTSEERMRLGAIYFPYLLVPVMLVLTMLFDPAYTQNQQKQKVKAKRT